MLYALRHLRRNVSRNILAYALASIAVLIVLVFRLSLHGVVGGSSAFLLFLAAVMASAWLGGAGPGLFAVALSALAGTFFFVEPRWSFDFAGPELKMQTMLFVVEGTVTALLAGQLRRARDQVLRTQIEARALERRILEISDAEQRRIGHDLHDGLGQHLTGIALMTRQLEQRLGAENSPHTARAEKIAGLAETAVTWTHDLTRSLSSPTLESRGLAAALNELASNAENIFGIRCSLTEATTVPDIGIDAAVHLYRIAQEAVSNAVKHGKALFVSLRLELEDSQLLMEIEDNGTWIPAHADVETAGMGLKIMRYRGNLIGASVVVLHRDERGGTLIRCSYPLPEGSSKRR